MSEALLFVESPGATEEIARSSARFLRSCVLANPSEMRRTPAPNAIDAANRRNPRLDVKSNTPFHFAGFVRLFIVSRVVKALCLVS